MISDRASELRCGYFAECENDADHEGPHTTGMYPEWTVPAIEPIVHPAGPSEPPAVTEALRLMRSAIEPIADGLDAAGQMHWADALRESWRQGYDKTMEALGSEEAPDANAR